MSETRQRWRLVFSRGAEAQFLSHLDAVRLWERAFRRGAIPIARSEGFSPRSRLVFAAPLPLGMLAEHELADLFLGERLTLPDLRARLAAGMPRGYRIVDLHDVWIGAPALAPQLVAADYRMTLLHVERARLEAACGRLLAADRLPRVRRREARTVPYDLRPLLLDLQVRPADPSAMAFDPGLPAAGLWMRVRHSQERGSARAEEVVAALAEEMGFVVSWATDDLDKGAAPATEGFSGEPTPISGNEPIGPGDLEATRPAPGSSGGSHRVERAMAAVEQPVEAIGAVRERLWLADELEMHTGVGMPSADRRVDEW